MRILISILPLFLTTLLLSCGKDVSTQPLNAEGFTAIEESIKSQFGVDAFYTDLKIIHHPSIGNSLSITVTKIPESLEMEEWSFTAGNWDQTADIVLEVTQGSKASDFMFQLGEQINLTKLGVLVEESTKRLVAEKNIEDPVLHIAFIKYPKTGDITKANYVVLLEPKNGCTSFTFYYDLSGEFIEMNYR